jgi:type II secretory pathway pseudopilin PulG
MLVAKMISRRGSGVQRRRRLGLTLVELLIVIVLLSIVVGGIMGVILRQQQFYGSASMVLDTRGSVRDGAAVLQSDLRALSPAGGDILEMGPTFIEFRQQFGSSVVCTVSGKTVVIAPLGTGGILTSWATTPRDGDVVLIYDSKEEGSPMSQQTWVESRLTTDATPNATCPTSTGLTSSASIAQKGWSLTLEDNVNTGFPRLSQNGTIRAGSAVRFLRRARYELYQAADNEWYLGFAYCTAGCAQLAPVSGPYLGKDGPEPGLEFTFYGPSQTPTADRKQVRMIEVTLRARSERAVNMDGRKRDFYTDSLRTRIAVRN